ncbi:uncharacterized protein LOC118283615 isoform X2 [Scophthalmus maximus]|uniref:uncharacterized protein LOC118283615 isoform X2 n=1 Tax=Scophthalmus maximus TaxID=52904 RepID=UPI001FA8E68F|nr:uncharacterized protein LOC118283615 isoform X2 [Scophthalmus maximus]
MISVAVHYCLVCSLTNMAVHLSLLLILSGLTGIHSMTTVRKVSVKAGDSITIPCPYDSEYTNRIKYLCQGNKWPYCSVAVKTNQPGRLGRFSISDDTKQRIFSVTVKDLYYTDTHFWCVVEIDWGKDVAESFLLSVTSDTPSLSVDHQEVTGFNGDDITINCYHSNNGEGKWCRLGGDCVTTSSGSIAGARVNISARDHFFTVTMSGLTSESTGWYLCIKGDLQMPVHVNVTERSITTTLTPDSVKNVSVTADQTLAPRVTVDLKRFIIPLSLLSFVVTLVIFLVFIGKKTTEAESSARAGFGFSLQAEEEVSYSTVEYKTKSDQRSGARSDVEGVYSSAVTAKQLTAQRVHFKRVKLRMLHIACWPSTGKTCKFHPVYKSDPFKFCIIECVVIMLSFPPFLFFILRY